VIGYPSEDLLLRPALAKRIDKAFKQLAEVKDIVMVFGFDIEPKKANVITQRR
jgi:NAD+ synthase (glutamine-hydrolysing)